MKRRLSYYDSRFGDTYEIHIDEEGEFESAYRFPDRIGFSPIIYDSVSEIPSFHRRAIEDLLAKNNIKHD
jgi:hypothetical protein